MSDIMRGDERRETADRDPTSYAYAKPTALQRNTKASVQLAISSTIYELVRLRGLLEKNPTCEFTLEDSEIASLRNRLHRAGTAASELCDSLRPGGAA